MESIKYSPRNNIKIQYCGLPAKDIDTVFEICDAEFNSSAYIHESFKNARGYLSWARYFLIYEVWKVAQRENIYLSQYAALLVAQHLAKIWFESKDRVK